MTINMPYLCPMMSQQKSSDNDEGTLDDSMEVGGGEDESDSMDIEIRTEQLELPSGMAAGVGCVPQDNIMLVLLVEHVEGHA
jgi:hypothetical protein